MCWMCDHPGTTYRDYHGHLQDLISKCGWAIHADRPGLPGTERQCGVDVADDVTARPGPTGLSVVTTRQYMAEVDEQTRDRVLGCTDTAMIQSWTDRVLVGRTAEEIFGG
jgi:hypothetical protein